MAEKKKPKGKNNGSSKTNKASNSQKPPFSVDIYNDLVNSVSIITLNDQTISLLKTNKNLQDTTIFYINAIHTYEEKMNISDGYANNFVVSYETITNKKFKLKNLSTSEISDVDDKLGFLKVFLRNTINVEWDDIVKSFSSNNTETVIATPIKQNEQSTKSNDNQSSNSYNSSQQFNAEDFMKKNNVSMDQIADNYIAQQANLLLQKDIMDNKFYQYKNKPTFFIFIKWLLIITWVLISLTYVVGSFSSIGISSNYFFITDPSFNFVDGQSYDNDIFKSGIGIPGGSWSNIVNCILSLIYPLLIIFYAYKQIRNNKNENWKFTCKTFITWVLLFYVLFSLIQYINLDISKVFDINLITDAPKDISGSFVLTSGSEDNTIYVDQAKIYPILLIKFITNILSYSFVGVSVILSIVIIIVRPKLDIERINQQIQVYIQDIKSGKITLDQGGNTPGFGGGIGRNPFSLF